MEKRFVLVLKSYYFFGIIIKLRELTISTYAPKGDERGS